MMALRLTGNELNCILVVRVELPHQLIGLCYSRDIPNWTVMAYKYVIEIVEIQENNIK